MSKLTDLVGDRIQINSILIVLCFVSVLALSSQSAASYSTYLLALSMFITAKEWNDVLRVRFFWMVLAFVALILASAFWSEPFVWREFASILVRATLIILFVVAFAECQLRGQVRRWLGRALIVVGSVAAIAAIWNFYETRQFPSSRLHGLGQLDHPNIAGLIYGVVLLLVVNLTFRDALVRWRVLGVFCALVLIYAIALTGSRTAWAGSAIGLVVYALASMIHDPGRFVAVFVSLGFLSLVLLGALISNEATRELVLPRGDSYRPAIWQAAWEKLSEAGPWFGQGVNTSDDLIAAGVEVEHAHNIYISVALQAGYIGAGLLLVLIIWALAILVRNYAHTDAKVGLGCFCIALSSYLVDGHALIDKVGEAWFLFWLPVAIALAFAWQTPQFRAYED